MALVVSSETRPQEVEVVSLAFQIPDEEHQGFFYIEYSAARFVRLLHKMGAIMHAHKIFADHMDILCSIHGYRKKPLQFEGPAVTFGQLEIDTSFFEEKMVSKMLSAVFSEHDTTPRGCKPVRLVLTERSHARINLKMGTSTMILQYAEESDPQSTLRVIISAGLGGIKRDYKFIRNDSWMFRRFPLSVD
jgi:hypothetical protein